MIRGDDDVFLNQGTKHDSADFIVHHIAFRRGTAAYVSLSASEKLVFCSDR